MNSFLERSYFKTVQKDKYSFPQATRFPYLQKLAPHHQAKIKNNHHHHSQLPITFRKHSPLVE